MQSTHSSPVWCLGAWAGQGDHLCSKDGQDLEFLLSIATLYL